MVVEGLIQLPLQDSLIAYKDRKIAEFTEKKEAVLDALEIKKTALEKAALEEAATLQEAKDLYNHHFAALNKNSFC